MKAAAKGASGQSRQGHGKGRAVDNHDADVILAKLFITHHKSLEGYLRRFVNEQDAEDIVHDVFLHLCRLRPTWITTEDAWRFLFVAARSNALKFLLKVARCDYWDPIALDTVESTRSPDGEASLHELEGWLEARLERDLRRVIRRRVEGLSLREIAEIEELSLATIKRRISQERRSLYPKKM
jgi:DNA-directed RNA polymerase specialized sigma24 family protein